MKSFLRKLILGKPSVDERPAVDAFKKRVHNIKAIWNNDHDDDIGIEKIFRLFLALSQFAFLGTYIKEIFGKKGIAYQDISVDVFVLFKVFYPFLLIYFGLTANRILFAFQLWFSIETVLYVPTLIFASDIFSKPRSYRRSLLLLFLNYIEIIFCFAVLYTRGQHMNQPFQQWYDALYFSIITGSSIGYGDYFPVTFFGKFLVSIQAMFSLIFVILTLNFVSNKVESKGYFGSRH